MTWLRVILVLVLSFVGNRLSVSAEAKPRRGSKVQSLNRKKRGCGLFAFSEFHVSVWCC